MEKSQATSIIGNTFNNAFNRDAFNGFISNLLNLHSHDFSLKKISIYDSYEKHIKSLELVAKYSDGQNNIDVFGISVKKHLQKLQNIVSQKNKTSKLLLPKQQNQQN